jgi:hypothetical protein
LISWTPVEPAGPVRKCAVRSSVSSQAAWKSIYQALKQATRIIHREIMRLSKSPIHRPPALYLHPEALHQVTVLPTTPPVSRSCRVAGAVAKTKVRRVSFNIWTASFSNCRALGLGFLIVLWNETIGILTHNSRRDHNLRNRFIFCWANSWVGSSLIYVR